MCEREKWTFESRVCTYLHVESLLKRSGSGLASLLPSTKKTIKKTTTLFENYGRERNHSSKSTAKYKTFLVRAWSGKSATDPLFTMSSCRARLGFFLLVIYLHTQPAFRQAAAQKNPNNFLDRLKRLDEKVSTTFSNASYTHNVVHVNCHMAV